VLALSHEALTLPKQRLFGVVGVRITLGKVSESAKGFIVTLSAVQSDAKAEMYECLFWRRCIGEKETAIFCYSTEELAFTHELLSKLKQLFFGEHGRWREGLSPELRCRMKPDAKQYS
jgi:hypothetical protein